MVRYRTSLFAAALLIILVAILLACSSAAPQYVGTPAGVTPAAQAAEKSAATVGVPGQQGAKAPGSGRQGIVVGLARAPTSIDPADHRSRESETVIRNMFDGLMTRDTGSKVYQELAESMTWVDDKSLEIKLRQGVKFHDGTDMTADDVVFTFNRIIKENGIDFPKPHTSPRKGLIAPLQSIDKKDASTVVMHFSAPWPIANQLLVHQQIVPKAYLEKVGTEGFLKKPIGTGPFKFVSARGMDEFTMARFDDFWGGAPDLKPAGKACVSQATFKVLPEASTRVAALLAGEVDIIQEVPADLADKLSQTAGVKVQTAAGTRPMWMELNVGQSPFDDVKVRQALNYAVDKDLIVKKLYGGRAKVLAGVLSPLNNFADTSLKPYTYDKDKAVSLLAEAGWKDTNNDKILDKDGKNFSFVIDTQEVMRPMAEAIASLLRDIGADAAVRVWEMSVVQPKLLAGERQAFVGDWGDSAFDPVGHMEAKWHGYVQGQTYGRANFSTYNNPKVNDLIKAGETEIDEAKRHQIYNEAQQILYNDAPAVFLVLPDVIEASSDRVQNWQPASDGRVNLHDVCLE